MKRSILVFGVISGVLISVFMGTFMAIAGCSSAEPGSEKVGMIIGFTAMIVAFSCVFVGIKNYRDKQNGGSITFGQAFLLGFMISLVASTLYVITWGVEYHFFMPNFMDKYSGVEIKNLQESGLSGAELEEALKSVETKRYNYNHNLFFFILLTYMEILPLGIVITLISALILKKKIPATT